MKARHVVHVNALEMIGTILPELSPSKNRSKRLTKKLHKKGARPLYGRPIILGMPASLYKKIGELARGV
jgi:hypothetical protein